jgi:hypothetical protein
MDEDTKKAIADAVAEAVAAAKAEHEEAIKGLKTKNAELIAAQKKAKEDADAEREAREEAEAKAAESSTDVEAVKAALKKQHDKELAKLVKERDDALAARDTANAARDGKLIDDTLKTALLDAGVPKEQLGLVYKAMRADASVDGDSVLLNGQTVADAVTEWASSDEGKHFVAAPVTSGTGTTAITTGQGATHGFTNENISGAKLGEFLALAAKEPTRASEIARSVGRTDLAGKA